MPRRAPRGTARPLPLLAWTMDARAPPSADACWQARRPEARPRISSMATPGHRGVHSPVGAEVLESRPGDLEQAAAVGVHGVDVLLSGLRADAHERDLRAVRRPDGVP